MPKFRLFPMLLPLVTVLVSACTGAEPQAGPNVRAQLAEGRRAASAWIVSARGPATIGTEQAVALGYLERLRLGLGGPFRLIDYASQDPRLSEATRTQLAWALLGRTAAGAAYEIDPSLLGGRVGGTGSAPEPEGRAQLELIQRAIAEATDPRAGELAVRLGYALAAAEGTLPSATARVVARVAALTRDRELTRGDANRLLDSARAQHVDALLLLRRWRAERRFESEAPFIAPLPGTLERQALELAPRLTASLRELAVRRAADTASTSDNATSAVPISSWARRSLLPPRAARVLSAAADSLDLPPLAPVSVALKGYLPDPAALDTGAEAEARRALGAAGTEEELVARFALLQQASGPDLSSAMALLWAAAGLRTLAQEPVWYPGYGGPSARELQLRFRLGAVTFDEGVPAAWRPYYRGLLASALSDMHLVLPALDLSGLRVRFEQRPPQEGTLALHDPHARRLIVSPTSVAGTIAHEIAHDLDWQVALRRYRARGDYATDRVMRYARGRTTDRLALRVQDLFAGVTLPAHTSERLAAHARRPAEVFARNIDWFVAVALAGTGRMNGYLTSVQDELLTGYGTVRPPELSGTAGDALIRILDVIAPVYPDTRTWFLRHYGTGRDLRSYDLARRVLETELPAPRPEPFAPDRWQGNPASRGAFAALAAARDGGLESVAAWSCRLPSSGYDAALERARRQLVLEAAGARARGLARERARELADPAAMLRLARELYGAPFGTPSLSPETEAFVQQLAAGVRRIEQQRVPPRDDGFRLLASEAVPGCALNGKN